MTALLTWFERRGLAYRCVPAGGVLVMGLSLVAVPLLAFAALPSAARKLTVFLVNRYRGAPAPLLPGVEGRS